MQHPATCHHRRLSLLCRCLYPPAAASQVTDERGSSAGPFIQSPHVSDAPIQRLHIFTRGGSIHSRGLCCSLTSELSSGHLLGNSARLASWTHISSKRCADLPVDVGGLQAPYQREGARLVPPRSLYRPPRPTVLSQGRASRQCDGMDFRNPSSVPPASAETCEREGRSAGHSVGDGLFSALRGLQRYYLSHCSTPDGSLKSSRRSDRLLPWSMSVVWLARFSANLAPVGSLCHWRPSYCCHPHPHTTVPSTQFE